MNEDTTAAYMEHRQPELTQQQAILLRCGYAPNEIENYVYYLYKRPVGAECRPISTRLLPPEGRNPPPAEMF